MLSPFSMVPAPVMVSIVSRPCLKVPPARISTSVESERQSRLVPASKVAPFEMVTFTLLFRMRWFWRAMSVVVVVSVPSWTRMLLLEARVL